MYSKGNSILEVDEEGGRMFLRVLTHLTMHDYPPLVSGALQLLFRHFSQRQEVLHTFKQVHTHTKLPMIPPVFWSFIFWATGQTLLINVNLWGDC